MKQNKKVECNKNYAKNVWVNPYKNFIINIPKEYKKLIFNPNHWPIGSKLRNQSNLSKSLYGISNYSEFYVNLRVFIHRDYCNIFLKSLPKYCNPFDNLEIEVNNYIRFEDKFTNTCSYKLTIAKQYKDYLSFYFDSIVK